jgi:hypothetical protein
MGKNKRWRLRYSFWIDVRRDDERELALHIDVLKGQRTFTQTVRDGLLLMAALRSGDAVRVFDVLSEVAPWYAAWIQERTAPPPMLVQADDTSALRQELAYLRGRIDALGQGTHAAPGLQPLAPRADDDEDDDALITVTKAKSVDGKQIANNFIRSMMALQGDVRKQ